MATGVPLVAQTTPMVSASDLREARLLLGARRVLVLLVEMPAHPIYGSLESK